MEKFDAKLVHKALYSPSATEFTLVEVPVISYLAVDGHGDPNTSPDYAEALEALYSVAYSMKFENKKEHGRDALVGPLEGLWRADDPAAFTSRDKGSWRWTMMIPQPPWVTSTMLQDAVARVGRKKALDAIGRLRLEALVEGRSAQILHHGPYDDEGPTLERLHHEFMPEHGLTFNGDHHEIYLNDPRRIAPVKLKTILRQPVRPA